mgnify:CR=1 FL=1
MSVSESFLPFARPDIGEAEIDAVARALRSGWVTTGPETRAFEQEFAAFLGGGVQAIAVNSATPGRRRPGDRRPRVGGHVGTPGACRHAARVSTCPLIPLPPGADIRFVDCDPATMAMAPTALAAAIGPNTVGVVVVHIGGYIPPAIRDIQRICTEHGLWLVEDAAHALPASCGGTPVGQLPSAAAVFSFYANKTMTTGEGGMVVTRDEALAARMRVMRLHGISRDAFDRFTSRTPAWYYEVVAPGFKYNLTDLAAALGRVQLARLPAFVQRRQQLAARYLRELAGLPLVLPPQAPAGDTHAWHLFVLRLADTARVTRGEVVQALADAGIGTSVHFVPLHRQPYWRDRYALRPQDFPVAEAAYQRMLSVPLFTAMSDAEQARVIAALRACLQ